MPAKTGTNCNKSNRTPLSRAFCIDKSMKLSLVVVVVVVVVVVIDVCEGSKTRDFRHEPTFCIEMYEDCLVEQLTVQLHVEKFY